MCCNAVSYRVHQSMRKRILGILRIYSLVMMKSSWSSSTINMLISPLLTIILFKLFLRHNRATCAASRFAFSKKSYRYSDPQSFYKLPTRFPNTQTCRVSAKEHKNTTCVLPFKANVIVSKTQGYIRPIGYQSLSPPCGACPAMCSDVHPGRYIGTPILDSIVDDCRTIAAFVSRRHESMAMDRR